MEVRVDYEYGVPLLSRKEVRGYVTFEGKTPSVQEFRDELSKKIKAKKELLVVRKIKPKFGGLDASFLAYVYDDEKAMKTLEKKSSLKKNFEEKKKKEEAPAEEKKEEMAEKKEEAPAEEKPVEEKKEEPQAEEKPAEEKKEAKEEKKE